VKPKQNHLTPPPHTPPEEKNSYRHVHTHLGTGHLYVKILVVCVHGIQKWDVRGVGQDW